MSRRAAGFAGRPSRRVQSEAGLIAGVSAETLPSSDRDPHEQSSLAAYAVLDGVWGNRTGSASGLALAVGQLVGTAAERAGIDVTLDTGGWPDQARTDQDRLLFGVLGS